MSKVESVLDDEAKNISRCPECKSESVYFTNDAFYCSSCGYVSEHEPLIQEE